VLKAHLKFVPGKAMVVATAIPQLPEKTKETVRHQEPVASDFVTLNLGTAQPSHSWTST
jgi:hypothetical protein